MVQERIHEEREGILPTLSGILNWRSRYPVKSEKAYKHFEAIAIKDALLAANASQPYQEALLSRDYLDALGLSQASAFTTQLEDLNEKLEDEISAIDRFDLTKGSDPGLYLIRLKKIPFSQIRRGSGRWILFDKIEELDELFICAGRFQFFKKYRWLFPSEFETAKAGIKQLGDKRGWPLHV